MGCTSATTHEFADSATICRCGKARTVERTVIEPPLPPCFVCGSMICDGAPLRDMRGRPHHITCNPARVCKCGALAPKGMVWAPVHGCSVDGPCATHSTATCCIPDPLYKSARRTFTVAEVKGMSDAALVDACAVSVLADMRQYLSPLSWNFAMRCRDAAVKRTKAGTTHHCLCVLGYNGWRVEHVTPADFARAALLAVAGEGTK